MVTDICSHGGSSVVCVSERSIELVSLMHTSYILILDIMIRRNFIKSVGSHDPISHSYS